MTKDYYEILGVERNADIKALKKAYYRRAKQYHPDKNLENEEAEHKFKELNNAYDVLRNKEKRAAYDYFGNHGFEDLINTQCNNGDSSYSDYLYEQQSKSKRDRLNWTNAQTIIFCVLLILALYGCAIL